MPSTIAFTNLANGQEITVPYEVDGTITTTGGNLIAVARQIDDGPLQDISGACFPSVPQSAAPANPTNFSTELSAGDCPLASTFYMLSIYCWDDGSPNVSVASVTFKTSCLGGAVATPPAVTRQ
jgi:hypothetical protein